MRNYYRALINGEKIPRKIKEELLGEKLSKSKLKSLLKSVVVLKTAKTMYEVPVILPHLFCPECGCTRYYGSANMTIYPEHHEIFKCLRCHAEVGVIDNSPFYHVLEFGPEFKLPL